jgi:hypothetical protein
VSAEHGPARHSFQPVELVEHKVFEGFFAHELPTVEQQCAPAAKQKRIERDTSRRDSGRLAGCS